MTEIEKITEENKKLQHALQLLGYYAVEINHCGDVQFLIVSCMKPKDISK